MADNFKFKILNSVDPQAQYDAIAVKNPMTFYLLSTGVGYFGNIPLFGGGTQKTVVMLSDTLTNPEVGKLYVLSNVTYGSATLTGLYFYDGSKLLSFSDELMSEYLNKILVTDMTSENYTGTDDTIATTKAIIDIINTKLNNADLIQAEFFRKVEPHTITEDDLNNPNISLSSDTKVGDNGLLFTADTENTDSGNEKFYFISLAGYLTAVYGAENSSSINMELTSDNKFKAALNINAEEKSLKVDAVNGGVYIEKAMTINTDSTPSSIKLVTEEALVNYIQKIILPAINETIKESMENIVTVDIDSLNREVVIDGNTYENLTEAINDVSIGGTVTLASDTASVGIQAVTGMNFSIDLAGNTLVLQSPGAGSPGSTTNGLHLLKDSNIIIKNGTIIAEEASMVIQNYSNLTLDGVTILGRGTNKYLLSNNYGNISLRNNTKIIAQSGMVAFDLYYGMASIYDDGITFTIEDTSVVIEGPIEYAKANRVSKEDFANKCKLITPLGYTLDIPDGYKWTDNGDGTQTLTSIDN